MKQSIAMPAAPLHDPGAGGRAAFVYRDNGRRLILALKHGDRHDIVQPASIWLARAAQPLLSENTVIAPIPLHWTRLLKRKFNQSALLGRALARRVKATYCPRPSNPPGAN